MTCSADKLSCMCISGCWSLAAADDDVTIVAVGVTVIGNVVAVTVAVIAVVRVDMLG